LTSGTAAVLAGRSRDVRASAGARQARRPASAPGRSTGTAVFRQAASAGAAAARRRWRRSHGWRAC